MILGRTSLATPILLILLVCLGLAAAGAATFLWRSCPGSCAMKKRTPAAHTRVTQATPKPRLLVELPNTQSIGLEDIAPGKRVAIIVMKGNWCRVCARQLQRLQARHAEIEAANAVVVGLNTQAPSENEVAAAELGLGFPILSDADWDVVKSFGLVGGSHPTPGVVFLDETGKVIEVIPGRWPGQPQENWIIGRLR